MAIIKWKVHQLLHLLAGASTKFSWGLSCPGKAGEDISVVLSNGTASLIEVTGKLS